jgi:hypothetical protein
LASRGDDRHGSQTVRPAKGHTEIYRRSEYTVDFLPKVKVEVARRTTWWVKPSASWWPQRRPAKSVSRRHAALPGKINRAEQILDMFQLPSCPSAQLVTEKNFTRPLAKIWRGRGRRAWWAPSRPPTRPGRSRYAPGVQA